jgi:hypothetical protein
VRREGWFRRRAVAGKLDSQSTRFTQRLTSNQAATTPHSATRPSLSNLTTNARESR